MGMDTEIKKEEKSQLKFNEDGSLHIPESIQRDLSFKNKYNFNSYSKNRNGNNNVNGGNGEEDLDIVDSNPDLEDFNYSDNEEYHLQDDVKGFNLYSNAERFVPLRFSNGKTQEDVVSEIIGLIRGGKRLIFVKGVCGTGKSAIALNIGKYFSKTSIIVPGKALQRQYMDDYSNKKYVLKDNHKKLKIKVITGRENHKCLFLEGESADHKDLPCKIELSEKNFGKLREYLKQNPKVKNELDLKEIRRMSIAPVCPFWSPIVPAELELGLKADKREYTAVNNVKFSIYNRKPGCTYYGQFNSYIDADTIIFNSSKYKLENAMDRKPATEVEIIDECDEFLDSFSNVRRINLTRFLNSLNFIQLDKQENKEILLNLARILNSIIEENSFREFSFSKFGKDPINIKENKVYDLFNLILDNQDIFDNTDEDSYCRIVLESILDFSNFLNETFILFNHEEKGLFVDVVSTNLAGRFKELLDKNKYFVLMSGTIHSPEILKNIFGLEDFEFIEAEALNQGKIGLIKTGFEIDCKYENFKNNTITREHYLVAFDEAVKKSIKPTLVHVNSFDDLPSADEKERYKLNSLITKSDFIESQRNNYYGMFKDFKSKKIDILFTTKCSRGVDFPGDQCNSIVFSKYPNPDAKSIFWKILKKTHAAYYWNFYKDKATREFLQKIYRGVRSKEDSVIVLSPDKRVLEAVDKLNSINLKVSFKINSHR